MKYLRYACVMVAVMGLMLSCNKAPKDMTPEDFLKIDNEILNTDLTPEAKEAVTKKYDYSLKQFEDFAQRVEKDPELKAKIGEMRLQKMQGVGRE